LSENIHENAPLGSPSDSFRPFRHWTSLPPAQKDMHTSSSRTKEFIGWLIGTSCGQLHPIMDTQQRMRSLLRFYTENGTQILLLSSNVLVTKKNGKVFERTRFPREAHTCSGERLRVVALGPRLVLIWKLLISNHGLIRFKRFVS
jgi:hypothetical protein